MMTRTDRRLLLAALCAALSQSAFAQSWVAPRGETSVAVSWQYSRFPGHVEPDGTRVEIAGSRSQAVLFQLDHGVTDRLTLGFSIPYTAVQYSEPAPGVDRSGINDGRYHGNWQDIRVEGRYNLLARPIMLTPFAAVVIPSHQYQTNGEVAAGRGLNELHMGLNAGRLLEPLLPNAYLDIHAGFVLSEKALGVSTNKSIANASMGLFLSPRLSIRALGRFQKTHGGLTCGPCLDPSIPRELREGHDRLLQDNHLRLGGGIDFALTPSVDLFAIYLNTVRGTNTHYGYSVAIGVGRTFRP